MQALATFTHMKDGTAEDWEIIGSHFKPYVCALPDRVIAHLKLLEGDYGGFPVDRYTHSLQTATRALRVIPDAAPQLSSSTARDRGANNPTTASISAAFLQRSSVPAAAR